MVEPASESSQVMFSPDQIPQTVEGKRQACFYYKDLGNDLFKAKDF